MRSRTAAVTISRPPEYFSLWRATSDPDFPWTGIIFGAPILAVSYWCTDQYIVQRTLAAKSIGEARRATFFASINFLHFAILLFLRSAPTSR